MNRVRSGVHGTPTFFLDGVRQNDGYQLETLKAAVDRAARARARSRRR